MRSSLRYAALAVLLAAALFISVGTSLASDDVDIHDVTVDELGTTSVRISWSTDHLSTGEVLFGTTPSYGWETSSDDEAVLHEVALASLEPNTIYYFEIVAWSDTATGRTARYEFATGSSDSARQQAFSRPADHEPDTQAADDEPQTATPNPTPTAARATSITSEPPAGGSFACLHNDSTVAVNAEWSGRRHVGGIRPGEMGTGVAVDLRNATIAVHDRSLDALDDKDDPVVDSRWGLVRIDSSVDGCVAGGEVVGSNPSHLTWDEVYDREGPGTGVRLGTTRNQSAVSTAASERPTVSGMYFANILDGPRFNGSTDWRLEHSWAEYIRDDCVENDDVASGVIYDTLFDGCYSGYSNRTTDSEDDNGDPITGADDTVTFERVLLRMEPMPGPHKPCDRSHLYFDVHGSPYPADSDSCRPHEVYGTGNLFKLIDQDDDSGSINPTFDFIDSVFVVAPIPEGAGVTRTNFPPATKIGRCSGVTVIYLGDGPYPGRLPPDGCYTLLTGNAGHEFWRTAVTAWHARHPDVAPSRKDPARSGHLTFPRPAFGG